MLTIIGYAPQFFPATNEQFRWATEQGALTTILCLWSGVGLQAINIVATIQWLGTFGGTLALIGTLGYAYLIVRRLSS